MLKHGSLFSGIGGFDIAASWMGWQNVFSCEKDPFCRTVLKYYWPNTIHYEDIYDFQATHYRGHIDIISGGFPCQPFSQAGRRKGTKDDRYLFPETIRIIKEARPEWIVLENVAGLFTILEQESLSEMEVQAVELFCADSSQKTNPTIVRLQRRVIGRIISEIASAGYDLPQMSDGTPIILCIPAAAVNAPHRRDRVWFVAHAKHITDRPNHHRHEDTASSRTKNDRWETKTAFDQGRANHDGSRKWSDTACEGNGSNCSRTGEGTIYSRNELQHANYNTKAVDRSSSIGKQIDKGAIGKCSITQERKEIPNWDVWPTESPVCGRDDGLSERLDGVTFPKWQAESIKAYGNAIVPQVAHEIFRAIQSVSLNHKEP